MIPLIPTIVSGIFGLFTEHQSRKAKKRKHQDYIESAETRAKLKRIASGHDHAASLDSTFAKGSRFMQRVSFFAGITPVVMCFFPGGPEHVTISFIALESLPDWYKYGLGGMLVSIWGYRGILLTVLRFKCFNRSIPSLQVVTK